MQNKFLVISIFLALSLLGNFFSILVLINDFDLPNYSSGSLSDLNSLIAKSKVKPEVRSEYGEPSIYLTGDIFLGRNVEILMKQNGNDYPFVNFSSIFQKNIPIVSNFESAIPSYHIPTPLFNTKFSVSRELLPALSKAGVTHASLANNHSYDYGQEGYRNAISSLLENNITAFGDPVYVSTSSVIFLTINRTRVSVLAIDVVSTKIDYKNLEKTINHMKQNSDYQIAFVHGGIEYKLYHSDEQEKLAHKLIDFGIDSYIGHHTHVVQDIEIYNNAPIFYSLGNLIFDQYFSPDVQQGLVLNLSFDGDFAKYQLIPVTSEGTRSQPNLMPTDEAKLFLSNIARRSDFSISDNIKQTNLKFPLILATSSLDGIIPQ